ncbi:MAG: TIM barrel protein [Chlorobiaceae bacterium]|jgi:sugar phosphate isomerase/epimerase|nr:TIM barrel protein [Chlorobiaceae bacterium]
MNLKQRFPFRIGTTSYIIPDALWPNVEYLSKQVDDVELLLFESHEFCNLPSQDELSRLFELAMKEELTYSVHLPLDTFLGHASFAERERSIEKCSRIVELTRQLPVSAFVMHAEAGPGIDIAAFGDREKTAFAAHVAESVGKLIENTGMAPSMFALETLAYPFAILEPVVEDAGLSVTLDIGHLELMGYAVDAHLQRWLGKTRVLHLHGIKNGKDHNSLQHMRQETLALVMQALSDFPNSERVVTMEIFSESDFFESAEAMEPYAVIPG